MPGIPSVYYGSEWGIPGRRLPGSDAPLRPVLDPAQAKSFPHPELAGWVAVLSGLRRRYPALCSGEYQELLVAHEQFAFMRRHPQMPVVVAVNSAASSVDIDLHLPLENGTLEDILNPGSTIPIAAGQAPVFIPPAGVRILAVRTGS